MNALLAAISLILLLAIALFVPTDGPAAALVCVVLVVCVLLGLSRLRTDRDFLMRLFVAALLVRVLLGTTIYVLELQIFFGEDYSAYDNWGYILLKTWEGETQFLPELQRISLAGGWGMNYVVAVVYALIGRNTLAIQFVNAVFGAATAPLIYMCAHHIFKHTKVARVSALFAAFFPSLVLWSSQGLKDGPIVFLLALTMFATLKLGERLSLTRLAILVVGLFGIFSMRFYVFYLLLTAVVGSFVIGMRAGASRNLFREVLIVGCVGVALTYMGVLRSANDQIEAMGSLEMVQRSRADLATSAKSGYGQDVDVSTWSGALTAIPVGLVYLLFAPFPWQMANLRQSITLPEMLLWWASCPVLVAGLWFTLKFRLRQSLPILIFTSMLTLAYSIGQGNIGTAYRQRAQVLVFYFIFTAAGYVLLRERQEDRAQQGAASRRRIDEAARALRDNRRALELARRAREREHVARGIEGEIDAGGGEPGSAGDKSDPPGGVQPPRAGEGGSAGEGSGPAGGWRDS